MCEPFFVHQGRVVYQARADGGMAKADQEIIARIFLKVRDLYQKEGGKFPAPILGLNWWYSNAVSPSMDEVCKEINGWAIEDVKDEKDPKTIAIKAGSQLSKFLDCRADGSTLSGNWLYVGMYTDAGNLTVRICVRCLFGSPVPGYIRLQDYNIAARDKAPNPAQVCKGPADQGARGDVVVLKPNIA